MLIQEVLADKFEILIALTHILPYTNFFPAEQYHANYYEMNSDAPYCQLIIEPKIEKVKKRFAELVKQ
jgi:peptide-methionine (S)-S-oxide reductase